MLKLAAYGFLSYSYMPLYLVICLCFFVIAASLGYSGFVLWEKSVVHTALPGQASLLLTVLITASVQLLTLAILAVYILKGFHEARKRPLYIVREKYL